ncbi:MAG: transcription-repair coupling factor [Peptoniphilus sp.]|nr:transcription-repair coupling factor [Peptoniphilus sp.]MDD7362792.1 transcription-repair coupling factor [Bacillota bacterium]MDY6044016.1 transcription-repair coupling factor [Peptoniphilus sp.]
MASIYNKLLEENQSFRGVLSSLRDGETPIGVYGLAEQVIAPFVETIQRAERRPILLVTYDVARAKKLAEDLSYYAEDGVYQLAARELFFFQRDAGSQELLGERLQTLQAMMTDRAKIVVTTPEALGGIFLKPSYLEEVAFSIGLGDVIELDDLIASLVEAGYKRVDFVEGMGQFSVRGGIVDIFTPSAYPCRIEFFDVEVDSIRLFDAGSQRSIETVERVEIFPVHDVILDERLSEVAAKGIARDLKGIDKLSLASKERASEKYEPLIEQLRSGARINNTDLLLPYIPKRARANVVDYFKRPPIVFIDEPRRMREVAEKQATTLVDTLTDLAEAGELLREHLNIQIDYESTRRDLKRFDRLISSHIVRSYDERELKEIVNFQVKTVTSFGGRLGVFQEEIRRYVDDDYTVVLLGGTAEKTKKLVETLEEMDFSVSELTSELKPGVVQIDEGHVHGGFEFEHERFVLLNSTEIFGDYKRRKKRKKKRDVIDLGTLHVGDYVVHESHGIGKFMGTTNLEVQGVQRDYISLMYRDGDKLFLPMDQLSLIHRYIATDDAPPKISRLNTQTWRKTKAKAKRSVEEMAEDLVELYSKREDVKGYAFSKDQPWQKEFEASFPYEETEGQLLATEEIKADMERAKPMDRLLCADVGYGKTEVALRAAFKAILDGKQVAFLVPTTILAQQHYNTMRERFSNFAVKTAILSRFRTAKEIKEDLEGIRIGNVDIVVGTHRLLSKDVKFKDLGLLIVDEEQRFGVRHKEKLKLLKENVDTLTLTATPIPRTLQMSLAGIRDMSVIDEPPQERFPVQTYVIEYNPMMVREAILKELDRGGQVYFVYNRVQSMERMLGELRALVPEARFAMANGQMGERELEDTMLQFVNREVDVLLCSTIIETGMDVSNANTMIIWEANRLGLSQLYQLRGRIGRSNRMAYAYFTYQRNASISEVAEKRLAAIREFTEFGSGYKIAMRDLEIRGSGNILGESQHGHMNAIGYDLYMKFLRQAVSRAKGEEDEETVETTIDVLIDSYIPKRYIRDESQRMEMYRKIAVVSDDEDEADIIDELIDRFSEPPKPVLQLIHLSKIRHLASTLHVESIQQKKDDYTLEFTEGYELPIALMNEVTSVFGKKVVFSFGEQSSLTLSEDREPLDSIEKLLELMKIHKSHTREK